MLTAGKIIHSRKGAGLTTRCSSPDIYMVDASMEKSAVGNGVGTWDQRKSVDNGEDDRICRNYYVAKRGNIGIC